MKGSMRIYFAGPLFSDAERYFNQRLAEKLESEGFSIYLHSAMASKY
jgi:nucleoside 2-deoxyribosyltransferase